MNSEEQSQLQIYMFNLRELNVFCLTMGIVVFICFFFSEILNPKPLPDGSAN